MINNNSLYFKQAQLLVQVLPAIAKQDCFALKGGTAINLFFRNMPRLSVDIDLTYLPIQPRDESLANIELALKQISKEIKDNFPNVQVEEFPLNNPKMIYKLGVYHQDIRIKVEPNLVLRGTVFPFETRELCSKAREAFGMTASVRVLSLADVYGGKICAALDRQHPRDLFDIKFLLDNEGITENIRKGVIVYLISHDRAIHETLDPILKDFRKFYETEFQNMVYEVINYEDLVKTRVRLVNILKQGFTKNEKEFLISFKNAQPDWKLLGIAGVENLPAVRWKQMNIQKMDPVKKEIFLNKLRSVLSL